MQFDQIIEGIKADPAPYAYAAGAYLIVGIFVLWRLCRRGDSGHFSLTGFARAILTALFALPIWPIVWLVWILHFRKFAPDALDLTNYRLPVVDLADHRADDIRFAPKKLVMDAEIVESPQSAPEKEFAPFGSNQSSDDAKPRPKTTPVSSIAAKTRPQDSPKTDSAPKPESPTESATPKDSAPSKSEASEPPKSVWPKPEEYKAAPLPSKGEDPPPPLKPSAGSPPPSAAPPASSYFHPEPAVAPTWPSVAVDPRTPEPPSAPPFVKKIERLDPTGSGPCTLSFPHSSTIGSAAQSIARKRTKKCSGKSQ